jgi:S-DNA-T family DNA segregation ATPase FtsK/SpoIIIE
VVLAAVLLAGALIATRSSLRRIATSMGRGVHRRRPGVPQGQEGRARHVDAEQRQGHLADADGVEIASGPALYDFASEEPAAPAGDQGAAGGPAAARARDARLGGGQRQLEIALGPGRRRAGGSAGHFLTRTNALEVDRGQVQARGRVLEDSLASHGVETRLVGRTVGPTVTRYELELGAGVKVARVTTLQRDIAYAMAATDVRILAPIPGRSAIGIEVPNHTRHWCRWVTSSPRPTPARPRTRSTSPSARTSPAAVFLNLATTPTCSSPAPPVRGKSSGLNCIITSLLMRTTPDQVRLILVDPKQVEMGQYNRLPTSSPSRSPTPRRRPRSGGR